MNIFFAILFIIAGLALIFYVRTKAQDTAREMKFMQTKSISDLKDMFDQMDSNGLGNEYREYVELKGNIVSDNLVETPFSNRSVAYCEATVSQVIEEKKEYTDSNGNRETRIDKREEEISTEKSSQEISIKDGSSDDSVDIELNATGCNLDIPKTFDRFEPKSNVNNYRFFNSISINRYGAETIGFKMVEKTISANQNLYVLGEAFKVGNTIHIGKPRDSKKPFVVTTKSEEDFINKSNQNARIALIAGVITIAVGVYLLVKCFM